MLQELLTKVEAKCPTFGMFLAKVPDLRYSRRTSKPDENVHCFYDSCLAVILKGSKDVVVGTCQCSYKEGGMILVTVDMPSSYHINPGEGGDFIALSLKLDLDLIAKLSSKLQDVGQNPEDAESLSFQISAADEDILNCLLRLVECDSGDDPGKAVVLSESVKQELYFHLLRGPFGMRLRQIFSRQSYGRRLIKIIEFLKSHYKDNISVDDLAAKASMAPPTFYKHFKEFTSISPLQYQKYLRLHEAKRLMLVEDFSASMAAYEVGYESQQQFNREYKRSFGLPPKEHIKSLKQALSSGAMLEL